MDEDSSKKEFDEVCIALYQFWVKNPKFFHFLSTRLGVVDNFTFEPNSAIYREGQRSCVHLISKFCEHGHSLIEQKTQRSENGKY